MSNTTTTRKSQASSKSDQWNPHKIPAGLKIVRDDVSPLGTLVTLEGKAVGRVQQDKITKLWSGTTVKGKKITDQITRLAVTDFLSGQRHYSPNTNTTAVQASNPKRANKPAPKVQAAPSPVQVPAA